MNKRKIEKREESAIEKQTHKNVNGNKYFTKLLVVLLVLLFVTYLNSTILDAK